MSKKNPKDGLSDLEYERALVVAELIKRNVDDIISVIEANCKSDDIYTNLAAYSSLLGYISKFVQNQKHFCFSLLLRIAPRWLTQHVELESQKFSPNRLIWTIFLIHYWDVHQKQLKDRNSLRH